ncbi:YIP1 family protein [bacterium]|nr:YIP1 family protein [bacterium]
MIIECPHCHEVISVVKPGKTVCPKCKSLIYVGDPLNDEENRVVKTQEELEQGKRENQKRKEEKEFEQFSKELISSIKGIAGLGTPWDNIAFLGFNEAFYRTTKELVCTPTDFFRKMVSAPMASIFPLYGAIVAFASTAFQIFWNLNIFNRLFPNKETFNEFVAKTSAAIPFLQDQSNVKMLYDAMHPEFSAVIAQLFLTPLFSILITSLILSSVSFLTGSRARIVHYYRMGSFVMVTGLCNIIPVLGPLASLVWRFVLIYKGVKITNNFSDMKAKVFTFLFAVFNILFLSFGIV